MNASIADESVVSDMTSVESDVDDVDENSNQNQDMVDDDDNHDREFLLSDPNTSDGVLDSSLLSKVNSSVDSSLDASQQISGNVAMVSLTDRTKGSSSKMLENSVTVGVNNVTLLQSVPVMKRRAVPTKSIQEMTSILTRNYAAYHSTVQRLCFNGNCQIGDEFYCHLYY